MSVFLLFLHMFLMTVAWLVLIPWGLFVAVVWRRMNPTTWYSIYRTITLAAVVAILVGTIVGFMVASPGWSGSHAAAAVMCLISFAAHATLGLRGLKRPLDEALHMATGSLLFVFPLVAMNHGDITTLPRHVEWTVVNMFLILSYNIIYKNYVRYAGYFFVFLAIFLFSRLAID